GQEPQDRPARGNGTGSPAGAFRRLMAATRGACMRVSTRLWLPILALLASLGWAGMASAEYLVEEAGLRFPDQIGAASQTSGKRYPQPGLGHGIDYNGGSFGASIYVYDRG